MENARIISNMNTAIAVVHEMPAMIINMNDDASDWSERLNTIVTEFLSVESLGEMPFSFHVDSNESNEQGSIEIYLDEDFNVDEEIEDEFTDLKHKLENEIQANIDEEYYTVEYCSICQEKTVCAQNAVEHHMTQYNTDYCRFCGIGKSRWIAKNITASNYEEYEELITESKHAEELKTLYE
jgi:hypothetical protein